MRQLFTAIISLLLSSSAGPIAFGNDSSAELSSGGLAFTRSNEVALRSERLRISPDAVSVRYEFVNRTSKPVVLTIAFALPDIDLSVHDAYSIPYRDRENFLGFETKIGGKPAEFSMHQSAVLGDKDVSDALHNAGVPLLPAGAEQDTISNLPEPARQRLVQQNLLQENGSDDLGQSRYAAAWTVKTAAVRTQTFEPNRSVIVEHRYRPSLGTSLDTILRKGLRLDKNLAAEVQRYRKDYCVSEDFLAKVDELADNAAAHHAKIQERRISYVLKTGANWAGPIKDFKLTVDKQRPDRLVSFCADAIKVISPTILEFTANNFIPDKDMKILMLGRF
jgi:hypothetical protein